MALKFFWRCEGTTLDGTHDYSAGDTSATATGSAAIATAAVKVGSNGVECVNGTDYYAFDSASIATIDQGSMACWFQYKTAVPTAGYLIPLTIREQSPAQTDDLIGIQSEASQELRLSLRKEGSAIVTLATTAANLAIDTWYFVTASWHLSADKRRIRVYDASGSLIQEVEDTSTDLAGCTPGTVDTIRVGNNSSHTSGVYVDNVFIGDAYADADTFYSKRDITSYTQYSGSAVAPLAAAYYAMLRA